MRKKADPRVIKAGFLGILDTLKTQTSNEVLEDIRARTTILIQKYHAMHVGPISMKVEWLEHMMDWYRRPWWNRAWHWLRGDMPDLTYPDIDAAVQETLEELSEYFVKNCPATNDGEVCILPTGHDGPHMRQSKVADGEMVEWEDAA